MSEAAPAALPQRAPRAAASEWLVVVTQGVALAAMALLWMPAEIRVDDAWISFRYAENFAAGKGLVFNEGELHLGTTSPLYAMTVGALRAITGVQLLPLVVALHLAAVLLAGFVVPLLLRRRTGDPPVWAGGLAFAWIFLTAPWVSATMGMETIPFVAVGLLMVLLCVQGRAVLLGAALPLFCMIRPDGAILGGILLTALALATRRLPVRTLATAALVGLPWVVFASITYGSPVPHTAAAKLAQARSDLWHEHFLERLWPLLAQDGQPVWAGLAVVGCSIALRCRERAALLVAAWLVLHNAVFALVGVPPYPWYYVVFFGGTAFLAVYAMARLLDGAATRWPRLHAPGRASVFVLTAAAALAHAGFANRGMPVLGRSLEPHSDRYHQVGRWLRANTPPDAAVAMIEVGIVGYFSQRRIVDLMGLVSPGVSPHILDRTHVAFAMQTFRPDYFVMHPPGGGHEAGLEQLADHGWLRVFALADTAVYMRLEDDEPTLAARLATALGERRGACLFADFPRWLDFARFRTAAAERQPLTPIFLAPEPGADTAWVACLQGDGTFRVDPFRGVEAATFPAAELRERWRAVELDAAPPPDGRARWTTRHAFSHLVGDVHLAGPLRRVRIRLHVEQLAGGGEATGTLAWTSTFVPTFEARNTVPFPVRTTEGLVDIVVELPDRLFADGERLERLLFAPLDRPGTFTIDSIRIERY